MNFTLPDGRISTSRIVDAFVNATTIGFMDGNCTHTYETMIARLQEISERWEHLLHLSGGALNLQKCSWYVLTWVWKQASHSRKKRNGSNDIAGERNVE
jgi:hypothetical protein